MQITFNILLPIMMFILALYYLARIMHIKLLATNTYQMTTRNVYHGSIAFIKTVVALLLLVFVHNSFHTREILELVLFLSIFLTYSVLQSSYSVGGFVSRMEQLFQSTKIFFTKNMRDLFRIVKTFHKSIYKHTSIYAKILVVGIFLFSFIPNASIFLFSNLVYSIILIVFLTVPFFLTPSIYFGMISLLIMGNQVENINFNSFNPLLMMLAFSTLFLGMSLDRKMQNEMFLLITVLPVKKLNFRLGYEQLYFKGRMTIYRNYLNHYYYVYDRTNGIVVVYHTDINARLSMRVLKKMVKQTKQEVHAYGL
jgi:hypothetical protein